MAATPVLTALPLVSGVSLPLSHSVADPTLRADLARLKDASDLAASGGKWDEVDSLSRALGSWRKPGVKCKNCEKARRGDTTT